MHSVVLQQRDPCADAPRVRAIHLARDHGRQRAHDAPADVPHRGAPACPVRASPPADSVLKPPRATQTLGRRRLLALSVGGTLLSLVALGVGLSAGLGALAGAATLKLDSDFC